MPTLAVGISLLFAAPGQAAKKPVQVSAGGYHTCALKPNGRAICWGANGSGQTAVPNVKFKTISAGSYHTCGVKLNGRARCWGYDEYGETTSPAGVKFRSIQAGDYYTCGIKLNRKLKCWGYNNGGQAQPPNGIKVKTLEVGAYHACAIVRSSSRARCWGFDVDNRLALNNSKSKYKSVSAGLHHTCGVKQSGKAVCVGGNNFGESTAPASKFKSVRAGYYVSCGIKLNAKAKCWGYDNTGVISDAPSMKLRSLSISDVGFHACAVRLAGTRVDCWGSNYGGESTVPNSLM